MQSCLQNPPFSLPVLAPGVGWAALLYGYFIHTEPWQHLRCLINFLSKSFFATGGRAKSEEPVPRQTFPPQRRAQAYNRAARHVLWLNQSMNLCHRHLIIIPHSQGCVGWTTISYITAEADNLSKSSFLLLNYQRLLRASPKNDKWNVDINAI